MRMRDGWVEGRFWLGMKGRGMRWIGVGGSRGMGWKGKERERRWRVLWVMVRRLKLLNRIFLDWCSHHSWWWWFLPWLRSHSCQLPLLIHPLQFHLDPNQTNESFPNPNQGYVLDNVVILGVNRLLVLDWVEEMVRMDLRERGSDRRKGCPCMGCWLWRMWGYGWRVSRGALEERKEAKGNLRMKTSDT